MTFVLCAARGSRRVALLAAACTVAVAAPAYSAIPVVPVSSDETVDPAAQHSTELEVDSAASGSTVVGVYQAGRFNAGGSAAAAKFATSQDAGQTWTTGLLPGLTAASSPAGAHPRVVDENVAYDRRHRTWLISSVPVDQVGTGFQETGVVTSRSTDGGRSFASPVTVVAPKAGTHPDKQWTTCDNTPSSKHYGTCYAAFAETIGYPQTSPIEVVRSTDGGKSWSRKRVKTGIASGYNAQPIVQRSGRLVVVATDAGEHTVLASSSSDGGKTFSPQVKVAAITGHRPPGLRTFFKPSVDVDSTGRVWVTWQDCRFRSGCRSNDLVITSSKNGKRWSGVKRIPMDAVSGATDYLTPGIGIDPQTRGRSVRIGITFNFIPDASCDPAVCTLGTGYVSSENGGRSWTAPAPIGGPVPYGWLPLASQGRMPGDYESVAFSNHTGVTLFPVVSEPQGTLYHMDMHAALAPPQ